MCDYQDIPCWCGFGGSKVKKNNRLEYRLSGQDKSEGSPTDLRGIATLIDICRLGFWFYSEQKNMSCTVYIKEGAVGVSRRWVWKSYRE